MREHALIVLSWVTVAILAAIAAIALAILPEGTQLPMHWNLAGEADRHGDAGFALFAPVVMCAVLSLVLSVLPRMEPLQNRMAGSAALYRACWIGVLGMMTFVQLMVASPAFGWSIPVTFPLVGAGLLLIYVGNVLPKSRPSFFVGIRTPWALLDTDNWIATHRLGAWTTMAAGAAIIFAALMPLSPTARGAVIVGAILVSTVPPVFYSWLLWRRRTGR
ncbi:SdpI family protein [Sphingosinicella soli]|uniref:Putative membrane protein n=1 Tax=Sphingosinicella soli TaxID=333708 RepID=A0A7W7B0N4_9SPHN|nr:SdpI family protein [Sphingosinicella soli]MBB4630795.1 putative membrane protein [Sphingosinicella soli]